MALLPYSSRVGIAEETSGAGNAGDPALPLAHFAPGREVFPHQALFNVFSHNSKVAENGYNEEENKMVNETRKIFGDPSEPAQTRATGPKGVALMILMFMQSRAA